MILINKTAPVNHKLPIRGNCTATSQSWSTFQNTKTGNISCSAHDVFLE